MGTQYEARLQGYIPLAPKDKIYSNILASELTNKIIAPFNQSRALSGGPGHSLIDTPITLIEDYGPGLEVEAGRFIDAGKGFWLRVGGYHFTYQNVPCINGVQAN